MTIAPLGVRYPFAPVWGMDSDGVTLKVELGLGWGTDPIFTLDDPNLGLDNGILSSPDAPFEDVTCDVRSLEWGSGANSIDGLLTRWEAGTCTIVLGNEDEKYNTEDMGKRLLPMVKIRITARTNVIGSQWWPMWYGYADSFVMSWDTDGDSIVTVTGTDGTKLLAAYDPPALPDPGVGDGETAAQRAWRILDAASWPDGRAFSANDGGTLRSATTMANDFWTQLLLNQDAELGATYIDQSGRVVFKPRDVWVTTSIGDGTYAIEFGPGKRRYENVTLKSSEAELRNIVYAARPGGTEQTVRDDNSVAQFLPHSYGRDDLPFTTDADSFSWANLILQTSAWPEPRIDSVEVLPQAEAPDKRAQAWLDVLSYYASGYGVRWLVNIETPGMDRVIQAPCQVMGWKHSVDREQWRIVYYLLAAPVIVPFTLDGTADGMTLDSMRLTDSGVTSISPPSATAAGGTGIQINGKGFAGATAVTLGGSPVVNQPGQSGPPLIIDTRINGYTTAHAAGVVDVLITTPTGVIQKAQGFTYT